MNGTYATISADIISSTSLSENSHTELSIKIKDFLNQLSTQYSGFWGRLVKGDSIECITENPNEALRIAILLKTFIKSYTPIDGISNPKFKHFGLRLVIGIGEMRTNNKELDIMDGEAIYLSGRTLNHMKNKTKDTFQIVTNNNNEPYKALPIIAALLNQIINKATNRQCETLFYKLQYKTDNEVANIMDTSRQNVNNNLNNLGWDAVEQTILYFEQINFQTL